MTIETVHQLFEFRVINHPNAIALVYREERYTYNELNQLANQAAHALKREGIKNKSFIGVYLERSPQMIISILAILKAGCAYLPLDTHYPKERVLYMIEDANAEAIITSSEHEHDFANVFTIDSLLKPTDATSYQNPENSVGLQDLIYVNYTSGSTGKPKGVAIRHSSVLHLLENPQYANLHTNSVMLQIAPAAFDAFTFELWGALLHGGTCVITQKNCQPCMRFLIPSIRMESLLLF